MSNFSLIEDTHNFIKKMDIENEQIEQQINDLLGQNIFASTPVVPPSDAKEKTHQIHYLEARLAAAEAKITGLENSVRERDEKLKEYENSRPTPSANFKRKEIELEQRVVELEKKLGEERKAMQRLQHLNKELMAKVKELGVREPIFRPDEEKKNMQTELSRAQSAARAKDNQIAQLQRNYQSLLASSKEFQLTSEELYNANLTLQNTIKDLCDKPE